MRLYLSSQNLGDHVDELLKLMSGGHKIAFIDNAKDYLSPNERKAHVEEKRVDYEALGLEFEEIDLREYFGHSEKLLDLLSNFDLVWGSGGNTFILRRAFAQSGLDKVLKELLEQDKLVYGGSSAGAIIATPSLKGTEHGDEPELVPDGYNKEIIWEGLNLVPYYIIPHYKADWYGHEFGDEMENYMKRHSLPYKALRDGQVILINGNKEEFLQ